MPRVMIICPVTERPVPTRFEVDAIAGFRRRLPESASLQCQACGRRHAWFRAEAVLEGQRRSTTSSRIAAPDDPRRTPQWILRNVEFGR